MLPKITSAMLITTHACNLACRYCFVHQEPSRMTFETAKKAAEFLIQNCGPKDTPSINFFGGEPMLLWDEIIVPLTEWVRREYRKPFSLAMTTNGTLLTPERIAYLKVNGINVLLSLDGAKETQDYNRPQHSGEGSFDLVAPHVPALLEMQPGMTLRMTAIPPTCHHIMDNIRWGIEQGYQHAFVVPNVFEPWSVDAWAVLEDQIRQYADYVIETCREGIRPIFLSPVMNALKDIRSINHARETGEHRCSESCAASGKCGLCSGRFASIHPNGNIYGCQEMTSNEGDESIFYIGNLDTGVSESRRYALMAAYDAMRVHGDDCEHCDYNHVCNAGCVANNYMATGDINTAPVVYCRWQRLVLAQALRIMQTLGGEKNAMFEKIWNGVVQ